MLRKNLRPYTFCKYTYFFIIERPAAPEPFCFWSAMSQSGLNAAPPNATLHPPDTPLVTVEVAGATSTVISGLEVSPGLPQLPPLPNTVSHEHGLPATPPTRGLVCVVGNEDDEGYDSDGAEGPFFDAVQGEGALKGVKEEEVGVENEVEAVAEVVAKEDDPATILGRIDSLKVLELKEELR